MNNLDSVSNPKRKRMRVKAFVAEESCKCPICNKEFVIVNMDTENEYRKHVFYHRVLGFICECNYEVENEWSIRQHVYTAHRGSFHCVKCRKVFDTDVELKNHEQSHLSSNVLMCDFCEFTTKTNGSLSCHIRCVHDETVHVCDICSGSFKGKLKFDLHTKRTHAEMKPCTECGYLVKNITRHIRTKHTANADKKYKCDHCGKGFVEKQKLNIHMNSVHTKETKYECRYNCGAASSEKGNRKKHEIQKHGQAFST